MAVARAAAGHRGLAALALFGGIQARVLPTPLMNIINGGMHAGQWSGSARVHGRAHGLRHLCRGLTLRDRNFHSLKAILKKEGMTTSVGDEGGFAPRLSSNEEAIVRIISAIEAAGYNAR